MMCPCVNCICMPVCRHKTYTKLFENCPILHKWRVKNYTIGSFLYRYIIYDVLHPSKWSINMGEIQHVTNVSM